MIKVDIFKFWKGTGTYVVFNLYRIPLEKHHNRHRLFSAFTRLRKSLSDEITKSLSKLLLDVIVQSTYNDNVVLHLMVSC